MSSGKKKHSRQGSSNGSKSFQIHKLPFQLAPSHFTTLKMSEDLIKQIKKAKSDKIEALNEVEGKHSLMTAQMVELKEARESLEVQVKELTAANSKLQGQFVRMMDTFDNYVKMNEEQSEKKKERDAKEKEEQDEMFDSLN